MGGRPVWLASLSIRDLVGVVPTERWEPERIAWGEEVLTMLLGNLGDPARQRSFRMCATLCRHWALTDSEVERIPAEWHTGPAEHLAGTSLEILWETEPGEISTRPCENPRRDWIDHRNFLPIDCGQCPPCLARGAALATGR